MLSDIIDSYLGDRAQVAVRKAIHHMDQLNARKLRKNVMSYLEKEYKHRIQYLM